MTVLEYVVDGLEQWLEVERECGVKTIEADRSILALFSKPAAAEEAGSVRRSPAQEQTPPPKPAGAPAAAPSKPTRPENAVAQPQSSGQFDFVFLHDRPLEPNGQEMMAKIVAAMGKTPESAPVVINHPVPNARAYVVLGARALKKFFPEVKAEPGQWIKSSRGKDVLVTYSPAFLLRFPTVTESVQRMKQNMWVNLKDLSRRLK